MKRIVVAIISSVAGLYFAITYKMPVMQVASAASETASMTLAPDGVASLNAMPAAAGSVSAAEDTDTGTAPAAQNADANALQTDNQSTASQVLTEIQAAANGGQGAASGVPAGTQTGRTAAASKTVDGPVATTRYGPVQVAITVQGNTIVSVQALQHPTGGESDSVNAMAVPKLQSETLQAQSANVATVSGATYTSGGWKTSLQGVISSAGI